MHEAVLEGTPKGKRPFGSPRLRINLKVIWRENVDWSLS
jgi:hypothetical protein